MKYETIVRLVVGFNNIKYYSTNVDQYTCISTNHIYKYYSSLDKTLFQPNLKIELLTVSSLRKNNEYLVIVKRDNQFYYATFNEKSIILQSEIKCNIEWKHFSKILNKLKTIIVMQ
jgi:hypothetical protein